MKIKFIRGTFHLGYAYRPGDTTASLPEEVAKKLVSDGYAVLQEVKRRPKKKKDPEVKTTHISKKSETTEVKRRKKTDQEKDEV